MKRLLILIFVFVLLAGSLPAQAESEVNFKIVEQLVWNTPGILEEVQKVVGSNKEKIVYTIGEKEASEIDWSKKIDLVIKQNKKKGLHEKIDSANYEISHNSKNEVEISFKGKSLTELVEKDCDRVSLRLMFTKKEVTADGASDTSESTGSTGSTSSTESASVLIPYVAPTVEVNTVIEDEKTPEGAVKDVASVVEEVEVVQPVKEDVEAPVTITDEEIAQGSTVVVATNDGDEEINDEAIPESGLPKTDGVPVILFAFLASVLGFAGFSLKRK